MTDPEILSKHCPYCRRAVKITMGQKTGKCEQCGKTYHVRYLLSKIKLAVEFVQRDYETEILEFIRRKKKTYSVEITSKLGVSKGRVSTTINSLCKRNLVIIEQRGKTKWVIPVICESE